jgi:hypothetical protein
MKKLIIGLVILGIAFPTFAGLKPKDVAGTWTYKVVMEYETLTGTLVFEKDKKALSGEVHTDQGEVIPMTKVEIRDNKVLFFTLEVDYNVMEISMHIDGEIYAGTLASNGGETSISGEKK